MTAENKILQNKLDILIKLTAINIIQGKKFKQQALLLSSVGLQPKEIADILGKTSLNVRVTLSNLRKEKRKKGLKRKFEEVENG